jgi:N-methylhydantoinase A
MTLDMGGTSTDVALCPGALPRATEGAIGGIPVRLPRVDVHTVGAGGGSLARRDAGGALRVGPESAGADPGPACYGRGGTGATVTDAHLVLHRLGEHDLLGGEMTVDRDAAREAVGRVARELGLGLDATAEGILRVAGSTMERALRVISLERGHDPREFTLVAFGGAGPLHGAELAEALGMTRVLVPVAPGTLSALGLVLAAPRRDLVATLLADASEGVPQRAEVMFRALEEESRESLAAEGVPPHEVRVERWADLRYYGQSFELTVPWGDDPAGAFHRAHRRRFGLAREEARVEFVALRVTALGRAPEPPLREEPEGPEDAKEALADEVQVRLGDREQTLAVYRRDRLRAGHRLAGPARLVELSSTTLVPCGWEARVDGFGQIHLTREDAA